MSLDIRHLARGVALQILYEVDSTDHSPEIILAEYANITLPSDDVRIIAYVVWRSCYDENIPLLTTEDNFILNDPEMRLSVEFYKRLHKLVWGVLNNRLPLDTVIAEFATEIPLPQMATIERNILRMALYEMMLDTKTPPSVAINEAVEIAKIFSTDSAAKFINGVLGAIEKDRFEIRDKFFSSEITETLE